MWNAAYIESVGEDEVKVSVAERLAANPSSIEQCALFGFEPQSVALRLQRADAAKLELERRKQPDHFGLFGVDLELPVDRVVAEWHGATHPHAFLL